MCYMPKNEKIQVRLLLQCNAMYVCILIRIYIYTQICIYIYVHEFIRVSVTKKVRLLCSLTGVMNFQYFSAIVIIAY